jgi:hypothetical protein
MVEALAPKGCKPRGAHKLYAGPLLASSYPFIALKKTNNICADAGLYDPFWLAFGS